MRSRIIQVGNSRGVRLPKTVLEQAHLTEEIEIEVEADQVVIRSAHVPRQGWDEAFRRMAERGDDVLMDGTVTLTSFDESEWKW